MTENKDKITNILLIEDNLADARLIQELLNETPNRRFHLDHEGSLEDGLRKLKDDKVDVVLLDLSLPDSHGLTTFDKAHAAFSHIPIIVLSGMQDEELSIKAVQSGAEDYLVKGHVDNHLLIRSLRYAIERKRTRQQLALYAEELRAKNAQMQADLNMAREIQHSMIPNKYPNVPLHAPPEESCIHFCHRYQPASTLGGDFFDILPISEKQCGVLICDVMGHGVRSALITAMLRGLIERLMPTADDPGKFMTQLNSDLTAILKPMGFPMFISAFYLVLDSAKNQLRFSNAGHPIPIHIKQNTGKVEFIMPPNNDNNLALGLQKAFEYSCYELQPHPDDRLVLYTDGLYEVEDDQGHHFGEQGLVKAIQQRLDKPTDRIFEEVLAELQEYAESPEFTDDICLVGIDIGNLSRNGK